MATAKSTGKCAMCDQGFPKAGMTRHVASCEARGSGTEKRFHLVVEGRDAPEYWMQVEARATAGLEDLDQFLRTTWLECCGHMSAFEIEGIRHVSETTEGCDDEGMGARLFQVLRPGMRFRHEYDFGTTTALDLRVVSEGDGAKGKEASRLLARNDPPPIACGSCGKAATRLCANCTWDEGAPLCAHCAKKHRCGTEMLLPVVNSPRTGMCGYTG
jgi:hypothetical protein